MSPKFSFKSGFLSLSLSAAAAFAVMTPAPEAQAGDTDRLIKCSSIEDGAVKGFCDKHGEGAGAEKAVKFKVVRDAMKAAEKKYEEAHGKIKCADCHKDGAKGGELTSDSKKLWKDFGPVFAEVAKTFVPH
jgi:hypothetical protein